MTTQTTRFRRFGLRTMFFVMTVAAVGLGLVVHEARWEEKLANTIIAEGGVVHYCWNGSYYDKPMRETPRWLKMAVGDHLLNNMDAVEIDLDRTDVETLRSLAKLHRLDPFVLSGDHYHAEKIDACVSLPNAPRWFLSGKSINDDAVATISRSEGIETILFDQCDITDQVWEHLAKMPALRSIDIIRCPVRATTAKAVAASSSLRSIRVQYCEVGDEGCDSIARLEQVTEFTLDGNNITDAGVASLCKLTHTTMLRLSMNRQITDKSLDCIANLKELQELHMVGTQVSAAGVAGLQERLPKCRVRYK